MRTAALIKSFAMVLLSSLLPASMAAAQRASAVKSPEVLPDHHVIFRVKAPSAAAVTINGDWMAPTRRRS